jgi:hypothetical protein
MSDVAELPGVMVNSEQSTACVDSEEHVGPCSFNKPGLRRASGQPTGDEEAPFPCSEDTFADRTLHTIAESNGHSAVVGDRGPFVVGAAAAIVAFCLLFLAGYIVGLSPEAAGGAQGIGISRLSARAMPYTNAPTYATAFCILMELVYDRQGSMAFRLAPWAVAIYVAACVGWAAVLGGTAGHVAAEAAHTSGAPARRRRAGQSSDAHLGGGLADATPPDVRAHSRDGFVDALQARLRILHLSDLVHFGVLCIGLGRLERRRALRHVLSRQAVVQRFGEHFVYPLAFELVYVSCFSGGWLMFVRWLAGLAERFILLRGVARGDFDRDVVEAWVLMVNVMLDGYRWIYCRMIFCNLSILTLVGLVLKDERFQ